MPFQVSFSQKAVPAGIIQAISAGADFSTVCDTNVTITAIVLGDLLGHTVLWEQVSGSAVTFTSPTDQLEVSYSQTNFDDKVFRFTVDKGTAFEEFDEVTVYGSPLDAETLGLPAPTQIFNYGDSLNADSPILKFLTPFPFSMHSGDVVCNVYTSATLAWNTPNSEHELLQYIVKERDNLTGLQNDVAILPNTANYFDSIVIGRTYKIAAVYRAKNSHIFQAESNTLWLNGILSTDTDVAISAVEAIGATVAQRDSAQLISEYDQEKLSILNHSPTPSDINFGLSSSKDSPNTFEYDQEILSIIKHFPPPDQLFFSLTSAPSAILISDYDQEIVTGGQVGGN